MRKRFPVPKGLGSRSYADRYADLRRSREPRNGEKTKPKVKFLSSKEPLKFKIRRTGLKRETGIAGLWYLILALPPLVMMISIFLSAFIK